MKELVMALIVSISGQADLGFEAGYIETKQRGVVAQAAYSEKHDKQYIVVNKKAMKRLDAEEQKAIIVHELAHAHVKHETGKASHKHKSDFRVACWEIAEAAGVDKDWACKAEH